MKKRIIIIGILVFVLIAIFIIWIFNQPYSESIWNMVLENEEDYTNTALIYYEDFQQQDEDVLRYSRVAFIDGAYEIYCYPETSDIRKIELNETEGISAMTVRDSCLLDDDHPVTGVIVYDGFVSFCNEGGRESLVYSIDGTRPSYLHDPGEDFDRIWVHKITDNWYHVWGEQIYVNGHRIRRN